MILISAALQAAIKFLALFQNEWVNQFLAPKTPDDNFASLTKIIINHEPKRTIFQSL
ncbi:MAG: hypothetical protein ACI9TO_001413, partial [Rickettsiales bacterium]